MHFDRFNIGIFKDFGIIESEKVTEVLRGDRCCIGGTATKAMKVIKKADAGVLLIEEVYTICAPAKRDFGKEGVKTLKTNINDNPNHNIKKQ